MEKEFKTLAGISLIIGSVLMTVTMILHPSGGNIDHINKIKTIIMVSHSLAIASLPFITFGFWGLSLTLLTKSKLSMLAFIISCFGLFATMMAAATNGLTLPLFASAVVKNDFDLSVASPIIHYGSRINMSMDYVMIAALMASIGIWSVLVIRNVSLPSWIGYYGLALLAAGIMAGINQYNFIALIGFRIFVFGVVSWIILMAIKVLMARNKG
jgi:hypothetical protein